MAIEIKVPDLGESILEATLAAWNKREGDAVAAGEPVVDLETDKVTLQVSAPQAGILQHIAHQVGETVAVGAVLATLAEAGETAAASQKGEAEAKAAPEQPSAQPAAAQAKAAPEQPSAQPTAAQAKAAPEQPSAQPAAAQVKAAPEQPSAQPAAAMQAAAAATGSPSGGENGGARPTPVAERMARQMGVDLAQVPPSGSGKRITKEDVQAFVEKSKAPEAPAAVPATPIDTGALKPAAAPRLEERKRMSRRRQTIARRLVEVRQVAAMLTTFNEIDMSAVIDLRKRRREAFKERYAVDLGYMSFFVTATIAALKAFPMVNAEIQGEEIVLKKYYDIGIAIGAEEGLVVPVLRDADKLNFAGIEAGIKGFVEKVKKNTLTLEDLRGGTFTITNGGVYGSLMSTPILNPPQVGILGMHAIQERPVAIGGQVVIRPMMYVALSYDHRLVDGREAVLFLVRIKQLLENPEDLLLG